MTDQQARPARRTPRRILIPRARRPERPRFHCVLAGRNDMADETPIVDSEEVFDWEKYEKAKPHFRKLWVEFGAAGKSLQEFLKFILGNFSQTIRPYLKQFLMDTRDGKFDQPKEDRPAPPKDPNRPPLIPGQTELTQEQKDYFMGQVKVHDTLERLTKKFNLLDDKGSPPMVDQANEQPPRTWPHPRISPKRPPPLEPGQTELTDEQKDFLRGRLKTLAMLQRLTKKFNLASPA